MSRTEWGVESPRGTHPSEDRAVADRVVANMQAAGHQARVVWRSVSDWQETDDE